MNNGVSVLYRYDTRIISEWFPLFYLFSWINSDGCESSFLFSAQGTSLELQGRERQLRGRLEGLGRLMSLLAAKVAEALGRYEAAQVRQ